MGMLGDRMKIYEGVESARKFISMLPIMIRLDGKCFSNWTRNLHKPYDLRMISLMTEVTKKLVAETNAVIGYTQSDEISLVLYSDDYTKQVYFDGKIQKIVSVTASIATYWFNTLATRFFDEDNTNNPAYFDSRAWTLPNKLEVVNCILWREMDATRNSINGAAQSLYSHSELHGVTVAECMDMLIEKGINWNDYPTCFKRGVYIKRKKGTGPENRGSINVLDIPPMISIDNKVGVIFDGESPILCSGST